MKTTIWQHLSLALILAVGFALPYGFAAGWINETRKELLGMKVPYSYERLAVQPDGAMLIQRTEYASGQAFQQNRTLDGATLSTSPAWDELYQTTLLRPAGFDDLLPNTGIRHRVPLLTRLGNEVWYIVIRREGNGTLCYFAGYDTSSRQSIGFVGRNGVQPNPPGFAEMIPSNAGNLGSLAMYTTSPAGDWNSLSATGVFLLSDGRLLKFDVAGRTLSAILPETGIVDLAFLYDPRAAEQGAERTPSRRILARTADRVLLYDPSDNSTRPYSLPEELQGQTFNFYPLDKERAAVEVWSITGTNEVTGNDVLIVSADGQVARRHEGVVAEMTGLGQSRADEAMVVAAAVPSPLVTGLLTLTVMPADAAMRNNGSLTAAVADVWPALVFVCVIGVVFALLAHRHLRQNDVRHRAAWLAFVFLFGLPGYVGYRLHRRFPRRDPILPPERLGYEIFA